MRSRVDWTSRGRGVSPLVGVVLLVAITVCLAAVVAASVGTWSLEPPAVGSGTGGSFDLEVDAGQGAVWIDYRSGEPIDVADLAVRVEVDGEPLEHQPPVPFVGAAGFDGAPEGPFNAEAGSRWTPGERAGVRVAGTNEPSIEGGDTVVVRLLLDGRPIAELSATAS